MKKILFPAGMMILAPVVMAVEPPIAEKVCGAEDQRCTDGCDTDKVLWFFKGENYENCMQQCDEQINACLAADLDVDRFEVILPRNAYSERDVNEKPSLEEYEIETEKQ